MQFFILAYQPEGRLNFVVRRRELIWGNRSQLDLHDAHFHVQIHLMTIVLDVDTLSALASTAWMFKKTAAELFWARIRFPD